jgi:HSP20 family protein
MTLLRWNRPQAATWPLSELNRLQQEVARFFEAPVLRGAKLPSDQWAPAVDLTEDPDHFVLKAELPGLKKEEIHLSLHDGVLTLTGERRCPTSDTDATLIRSERFTGRFERSIVLPKPVAGDKVRAGYEEGILTVTLPKAEEAKPRQIQIGAK